MSLSDQIRAVLRASASAAAPLKASEIRDRLVAMGVEDVEDIHKRLSHLVHRGEIVTTGEARGKGYWMADRFTPPQRSPRNRKADGPGLTERILAIVAATPGIKTAEITARLTADGVELREGQPSTTISRLHDRGQLRAEGSRQRRGYFVVGQAAAKRDDAGSESPVPRSAERSPPAPAPAATVAAPPSPRHVDDPIAALADAIEQHLQLAGEWMTSTLIAEDLDEEPIDVAKALRRLVESKRANLSTACGVREYAVGLDREPAPSSAVPADAVEATEAAEDLPDWRQFSPELKPFENPLPPPPPAYGPEHVAFGAADVLGVAVPGVVAPTIGNPNTVPGLARCIALDIEDAIGRACDQRMPHHAIKALATAAACMRRAIDTFTTGAPAPLTATDGVLQS